MLTSISKLFSAKIFLLVTGICCYQIAFSQKKLQTGYIITTGGDTAKGLIGFYSAKENPDKIIFKETVDSKTITYHPADIHQFRVDDEKYESAIVKIDKSSDKVEDLNSSEQLTLTADTVFLYALKEGKKSLFIYKDEDGKEHFFIKEDSGFQLLEYKTYLKQAVSGNTGVASNNQYLRQLSSYFLDCPAIQLRLADVRYTQSDLERIFDNYYKCTNSVNLNKKIKRKIPSDFGLIAGFSSSTIKFSGSDFPYLTKINFPASNNFAGGLFGNIYLRSSQWSFYNNLLYTSLKAKGFYKQSIQGEEIYDTYTFSLSYDYINLKSMLRFAMPVAKNALFVEAGVSNGFVLSKKNNLTFQRKTYSQISTVEGPVINNSRKYEQGLIAGVGFRMKNISVEGRAEVGNGMSNSMALSSSVKRLFVLAAFNF